MQTRNTLYTPTPTYFNPCILFQLLHLLGEASKHGSQEHDLLVLLLDLLLELIDVVIRATQETLQTLKLALLQMFRQLLPSALKCTAGGNTES